MPIPKPDGEEKQDDYISRCMAVMAKEDKPQNQAAAICYAEWKKHKMSEGATYAVAEVQERTLRANPLRWEYGEKKVCLELIVEGKSSWYELADKLADQPVEVYNVRPCKYCITTVLSEGPVTIHEYGEVDRIFTIGEGDYTGDWCISRISPLSWTLRKRVDDRKILGVSRPNIELASTPIYNREGAVLQFEALALAPGVWTGIDGHSVKYEAGPIQNNAHKFAYQRIKSAHKDRDTDVVGFSTGYKDVDGQAWVQGYIFDQAEIQRIEESISKHTPVGISPELSCTTTYNDHQGYWLAHDFDVTGLSLVDKPACKTCWVTSVKKTTLANESVIEPSNPEHP